MKKILSMLAASVLLLAASSCTDEKVVGQDGGELVQVTFTLSGEGVASTRAGLVDYPNGENAYPQISDGSKANRLVWAVYDKEGNLLPELAAGYNADDSHTAVDKTEGVAGYGQVVEKISTFPHTITITLVRGQEYTFAFWAQDEKCTAFNTQDLRAVSVDYKSTGNNIANDELRDAFCKVETFTVTSAANMTREIILRRPFAQVNVGIPQSEYEALRQSGVRIKKSKIHMENVATEFDVVANSTHGDDETKRQAIDYEYNYIPAYYNYDVQDDNSIPTDEELTAGRSGRYPKTQDLKIDLNHDGQIAAYGEKNDEADNRDETYNYMLMAYILPADRNDGTSTYSTTLDRVEFSLLPEDEGQAELTMSLENVPVQRNWRTNIFGSMFTSEVNLQIDLDPFYAGDYNYPEWERIYEGVTYNAMDGAIHISNGAGLVWLSNATNGVWAKQEDFEKDATHSTSYTANIKNNADLFLKAVKLEQWPEDALFHFKGVTIKLDADIDLKVYANLFHAEEDWYFTPIGFGGNLEFNQKLDSSGNKYFAGTFDGQGHTIYNMRTTRPANIEDDRSMGLFSTVGRVATIKDVRLKDIDIKGNYRTGGIVGLIYGWDGAGGATTLIDNCYVDGGSIVVTSMKVGEDSYDEANNVAGIVGQGYNAFTVSNCFVRNLTVRAYRALSGIVGQVGGDMGYSSQLLKDNKVYGVTLIADQYQDYGTNLSGNKEHEIDNFFCAKDPNHTVQMLGNNEQADNKIYAFSHPVVGGQRTTTIDNVGLLSNPPLDIFPRLGRYADLVLFKTSVLGGPSAYKKYIGDDSHYKGTPDTNSGLVGLWVSGLTVDGSTGDNLLDCSTITASGVNTPDKDCVVYVKDAGVLKNITFHGATYAGQGICLAPASGKTIELNNVLSYDARKVLTDDGNGNDGTLVVTNSNFRGYVSLSSDYNSITFSGTTFEGSTKRADGTTINKLELKGAKTLTLTGCSFLVEPGSTYEIDAPSASFDEDCKAYAIGKPVVGVQVSNKCTISVDAEGNVTVE